eukprot:SM000001S04746  [mRNA]  locus=s1:1907659:1913549:- [translate_table: standard]
MQDERFLTELKELYAQFLTGMLPAGNDDLKGHEAESILQFKNALGLEDPDAASVHIEIGRRLFRQRMEVGDKESAVEERKSFQKLVYVSTLVFGEAHKFLLPWKRVFKVTESQVDIAIRDNAEKLFQAKVVSSNADPDVEKLQELRAHQMLIKLTDERAADIFRAHARSRLEKHVSSALSILKARTRVKDIRAVLAELDEAMAYNAALSAIAQKHNTGSLVPGVGPVSVFGGEFDGERGMDDLKLLYRTYLNEVLNADRLEDSKVEALSQLRNIFGLGKKEAEEISSDVTGKVYRRKLAAAVQSGALDGAASKADFLEELCDKLRFDPEKAFAIHTEIYRQKLEQCLEDKKLSDDDLAALLRLRVLLCIPQSTVDDAHADICGKLFTKVVDDAIGAGVDGYDADMRKAVQNASKGLRLTQQAAIDIASKAVKAVFATYVKRAKSAGSRIESARELKKMVIFSNLVVGELLTDIKGEARAEPEPQKQPEAAVQEAEYDDEVPMVQTMKKTRTSQKGGAAREGIAQKDINLRDELELRDRTDLYRTFLLFCLSGDSTGMPMGTTITTQRDSSEFARLGQLGDILGLTTMEVAEVHRSLAEQAFKGQAQTLLADGQLSKTRAEQLKELQSQLGLDDQSAQKVVKSITSTKMAGAIDSAVAQGRLSVQDIKELKEAGVDIENMVNATVRTNLFRKLVEKALTSGTGDFNEEEVFQKLPADLGLDAAKLRSTVVDIAKERLKNCLIQAVSLLRQKKPNDAVTSLNNLLSCDKASRAEPLSWPVKEELLDLYSIFVSQVHEDAKAERLAELLAIDQRTREDLRDMVKSGGFSLDSLEEEKFVF